MSHYCFTIRAFDLSIKKKHHAVAKVCVHVIKSIEITTIHASTIFQEHNLTETTSLTQEVYSKDRLSTTIPLNPVEIDVFQPPSFLPGVTETQTILANATFTGTSSIPTTISMDYNEILQDFSSTENSTWTTNACTAETSLEASDYSRETSTIFPEAQSRETSTSVLNDQLFQNNKVSLYPNVVEVYQSASFMARVTAPLTDPGKARFTLTSDQLGLFNITQQGGIIFVMRRDLLVEAHPTSKITIEVDWKEHRQQIVVTLKPEDVSCSEDGDNFCARHDNQDNCEASCGVGSRNSRCKWRPHQGSDLFSKTFATCVPDLEFCSDQICDALELLGSSFNVHICPQDCSRQVFGNVNTRAVGISSSSKGNVCTCDDLEACFCGPTVRNEIISTIMELKTTDETSTEASMTTTVISSTHDDLDENKCGPVCVAATIGIPILFLIFFAFMLLTNLLIYSLRNNMELHLRTFSQSDSSSSINNTLVSQPAQFEVINETSSLIGFREFYSRRWEIDMSHVKIGDVIGKGEFGKVMLATIQNAADKNSSTVVIKTVKDIDNESELISLKKEFEQLQKVSDRPHLNVIRLVGCSSKGEAPFIFLEFCVFESLKDYLMASRLVPTRSRSGNIGKVTAEDILRFSNQVASGMSHLASLKLVHRDLAARNILLNERKICKISDFGLTRKVCNSCDVYSKSSDDKVPVKWMAPESLSFCEEYTTKSDVWSFGILGYELVMLGGSPYPSMVATKHAEFFSLLLQGYRMQCPVNCSQNLFSVFESCWALEPGQRPTFADLVMKFEAFASLSPAQLWSTPEFCDQEQFDYDYYKNYIERVQRARMVSSQYSKRKMASCEWHCSAERMAKSHPFGLTISPLKNQQQTLKASQSMSQVNNSGYDSTFDSVNSLRMRQYQNYSTQALSEVKLSSSTEIFGYLPMSKASTPPTSSTNLSDHRYSVSTFLTDSSRSYILASQMWSKGTTSSSDGNSTDIASSTSFSHIEKSSEEG